MNNTNMKCRKCFWGNPIEGCEKYECHYERPFAKGNFPTVNDYDWCHHFTDEDTLQRPFEAMPTYKIQNTPDAATVRAC